MATPPRRPSLPATPESFRRSFTAPLPKLSPSPRPSYVDSTDAAAEILYSHPTTTIYSFSPPSIDPRFTKPASLDLDFPIDAVETLPWTTSRDSLEARGLLLIEKVPGSTTFFKSGKFIHAVLKNSQCWCVDGDSKFVLRRGPFRYYRFELPNASEEEKKKIEELKVVLGRILRFEGTPCPFKRDFTVELPSDVSTPKKKKAWRPRQSIGVSSPLSMNSYEEWRESRRPSTAMSTRSLNTDADSIDESICSRSESRAESYFGELDGASEESLVQGPLERDASEDHVVQETHQPGFESPEQQMPNHGLLEQPDSSPIRVPEEPASYSNVALERDVGMECMTQAPMNIELSSDEHASESAVKRLGEVKEVSVAEPAEQDGEDAQGVDFREEEPNGVSQPLIDTSTMPADSTPLIEGRSSTETKHDNLDQQQSSRSQESSIPNSNSKGLVSDEDPRQAEATLTAVGEGAIQSRDDLNPDEKYDRKQRDEDQLSNEGSEGEVLVCDAAASQTDSAISETCSIHGPLLDDVMTSSQPSASLRDLPVDVVSETEHVGIDSNHVLVSNELSSSVSSFSSMASFHTTVPTLPPSPPCSQTPSPDRGANHVNAPGETSQLHKRGLSEVTVTDPKPISETASEPSEHPSTPKLSQDSGSEGDWPDVLTPAPTEGVRQRRTGKRSGFSPLPPASTLLTSSPRQSEKHLTTAIVQKAVSVAVGKPLEAVILLFHVLGRIASGATVQDLMSGELFRQPQSTSKHRRSTSLNEDDYGIPIRGRTRRCSPSPGQTPAESWHDLD